VIRLSRADLESVIEFLGDIAGLDSDESYAPEFHVRLQQLFRCESSVYQEYEFRARRACLAIGFGQNGAHRWGTRSGEPPEVDENDGLYWRIGPCEIVKFRVRERDLEAVRMSDVIPVRRFRETWIYREYFGRFGIEHFLDLGLPDRSPRQRSLILFRKTKHDFSERDRALLELLRPHLYHLETHAALRQRLADALREQDPAERDGEAYADLTPREREIVELVAEGKTNAEIAAQLWIAPSTVKKHLEHVYGKLGVGRRTAAVTLVRSAL
jgi:DNA-binding CsgD family transcriptional regulator